MANSANFKIPFQLLNNHLVVRINIITLDQRHSTEYVSDVLEDLKGSFSTGRSHASTYLRLCFKQVFHKQLLRGQRWI